MATKKPLKIGDTAPIEQFGATDTIPPANIQNGIPAGGTTGQVLEKISGTDYNTQWATPSGGGASYLVYTALLTQSGTSAPVATVLENTLGGTVTWSYEDAGRYLASTEAATFTVEKTWIICSSSNDGDPNNGSISVPSRNSSTVIKLITTFSSSMSDNILNAAAFEIRVYS